MDVQLRLRNLITFGLLLGMAAPALAQEVGSFEAVTGTVQRTPAESPESPLVVEQGDKVAMQDVVTTFLQSKARLRFQDASTVSLGENTRLRITKMVFDPDAHHTQVHLDSGVALFQVTRAAAVVLGQIFEVITPFATIRVKGTSFLVKVEGGKTEVIVLEGSVEVAGPSGASVTVNPGEKTEVEDKGPTAPPADPAPPVLTPPAEESGLLGQVFTTVSSLPGLLPLNILGQNLGEGVLAPVVGILSSTTDTLGNTLKTTTNTLLGPDGFLNNTLGQTALGLELILGSVLNPDDAVGLTRITGRVVVIP